MLQLPVKRLTTVLFFFSAIAAAQAQNATKENAPYSRYGIGEIKEGGSMNLRGIGNAHAAYANTHTVNTENPASYSFLKLTTYEAGLEASLRSIQAGNGQDKYKSGTLALSYLNIGIPIGKNFGMALGLKPQSRVYYHIADSSVIPGIGNTVRDYIGEGGLNYVYGGLAGKYKGFSLGFNLGYSFGTINNTNRLTNLDTTAVLNSEFLRQTNIGGLYWKGGAQYETRLNNTLGLRLGATAQIEQSLNATRNDYRMQFYYGGNGGRVNDSAFASGNISGKIVLPLSYSGGAQLFGDNWNANLSFNATQWGNFRNFEQPDSLASQTWSIQAGGEYTPDPLNLTKYLQRVTYRLGFSYGTDYVQLRGQEMNYFTVAAGISFPFRRSTDRIHTVFEYGQRGTLKNALLKESFYRFGVGISLNDRWFIKRKYD